MSKSIVDLEEDDIAMADLLDYSIAEGKRDLFPGTADKTAEILREERLSEVKDYVCDILCRYPEEKADKRALDAQCEVCELEKMLCRIGG